MSYIVHRPKHFTVTLTWDIEADTQAEAEQKVREVMEQVDGELEEISMEQDGHALILTIDEDMEEERICPKCGESMVLCEDEETYHQIWECDKCGYKEED